MKSPLHPLQQLVHSTMQSRPLVSVDHQKVIRDHVNDAFQHSKCYVTLFLVLPSRSMADFTDSDAESTFYFVVH